jgi:hypothetical protein
MKLTVSSKIATKLANKSPPVSIGEVIECFATRDRPFLIDDRENNRTDPPTLWFISDTSMGRLLKVVFIRTDDGEIILKTAYDPNDKERWVYQTLARGTDE